MCIEFVILCYATSTRVCGPTHTNYEFIRVPYHKNKTGTLIFFTHFVVRLSVRLSRPIIPVTIKDIDMFRIVVGNDWLYVIEMK